MIGISPYGIFNIFFFLLGSDFTDVQIYFTNIFWHETGDDVIIVSYKDTICLFLALCDLSLCSG
jgi:hypothetical protein